MGLNRRTSLLLGLLLVVAAAAIWSYSRSMRELESNAPITALAERGNLFARKDVLESGHPRMEDAADILTPFGPRLGRMADAFHEDFGIDLHVVTTSEAGTSIEWQAERIFRERKIGATAPTGGLLVLLNPAIRAARIEVGYSLEGGLTDLHMGRIARDQLAPYASYTIAGMAVMDVLHYLRDHVYVAAARGNVQLGEEYRRTKGFAQAVRFVSGGAGAKTVMPDLPMDSDLKRVVPSERRARYAPSARIEESVEAFLRAKADLAGDPTLELFTEGSRLMRAHFPLAPFEELDRLERIQASMPLEYASDGDYAVATSKRPASGFVPILLHREEGLWRIDLVETWKNLFFDQDGNYFLRNSNTPYARALAQFGKGRYFDIASFPLGGVPITEVVADLGKRDDALATLWRAEVLLRNAFLSTQAIAAYEAAMRAAPEDPLVRQTFAERAMYLGFPELAIPALEKIGRGFELELAEAYNEQGNAERARDWVNRALAENPYDWHALHWRKFLAERHGSAEDLLAAEAAIAAATWDPGRRFSPVTLEFDPARPAYRPDTTVESDGVRVFDHSEFRVTMTNTSNRPIAIESVRLVSEGVGGRRSGLGDIRDYWRYPSGQYRLGAGESVSFDKLWGFNVDTGHEYVRYTFHTCWRGAGEEVRQCRTQWVDAMP
jgi:tetratricopeptide (TPR) repeat protein